MNQYRTLLANLTGWALPEIPNGGRRLKQVEDMLDAALCAEIGYRYWRHGRAQSDVFGTAAKGYIVVPCRAS
jgi:predicted RNase H-like nuclease